MSALADYTEGGYRKLNYAPEVPFSELLDAFGYSSSDRIFATVDYRLAAVWEVGMLSRESISDAEMAGVSNALAYLIDQMPDRSTGQILRTSTTDIEDILRKYEANESNVIFADEIRSSVAELQRRGAKQGFLTTVPERAVIEQMKAEFEDLRDQGLTEQDEMDSDAWVRDHSVRGRSGRFAMRHRLYIVFMMDQSFGDNGVLPKMIDRVKALTSKDGGQDQYSQVFKKHREIFLGHVDRLERTLQGMGFEYTRQTGQDLVDLMFRLLNPERAKRQRAPTYSGNAPLREIIGSQDPDGVIAEGRMSRRMIMSTVWPSDDGWEIEGHHYRVTSVKHMAEIPNPHLMQTALSETEGPGWTCFNFRVRDQRSVRMIVRVRKGRQASSEEHTPQRGFFSGDEIKKHKNAADIAALDNATNPEEPHRRKVVDAAIHVICRDATADRANRRARALESLLWESGYREELRADAVIHQTIPLNFRSKAMRMLRRTQGMLSSNMTDLIPAYGAFPGFRDGRLIMNNADGTPILMDPFTDATPAPHQLVVGGTGSGKSFLVNAITMQMRCQLAPKTIIIDKGRSFEDLCESMDGQYVYLVAQQDGDRQPICMNPLHISDHDDHSCRQPSSDEIEYMQDIIVAMCKSGTADESGTTESVVKSQKNLIQRVLIEIFDARESGQELVLSDFYRALGNEDEAGQAIQARISEFTRSGIYGLMFDGPLDVNWDNPTIVIETERFGDRQAMDVVMLSILSQIDQYMKYRLPPDMPKMLIIDEAWRVLSSHARAVGQIYREARKYGCSITLISQSVKDFLKIVGSEGDADDGISANTNHFYFLGSNPADRRAARELLELEPEAEEIWRNTLSVPPFYTEFLYVARTVASQNFYGAVRLYSSPITLWLSSSHPKDKAMRAQRIEQMHTDKVSRSTARRRAIQQLAEEYPYGSRYDYQINND